MELTRTALSKGSAGILGYASLASAQTQDPLASWNAGPAKAAIIDFVSATTDASSAKFVPRAQHIATFDQDDTLWVEHLNRVPIESRPFVFKNRPSPVCCT